MTPWRARSRYWKYSGLFLLFAAAAVAVLTGDDGRFEVVGALLLLVAPLVVWMWRIAAWEEATGLVVRNWFGTKRIPWHTIEAVELTKTFWSHDWVYAAVRHDGHRTYVKAMIAVFPFSADNLVAETRDLAQRHGLNLNESSITTHGGPSSSTNRG